MKKIAWYLLMMFCLAMTFYHHGDVVAAQEAAKESRLERAFMNVSLQVRESLDYILDRADFYCTSSIEEFEILVERWTKYIEEQRQRGKA